MVWPIWLTDSQLVFRLAHGLTILIETWYVPDGRVDSFDGSLDLISTDWHSSRSTSARVTNLASVIGVGRSLMWYVFDSKCQSVTSPRDLRPRLQDSAPIEKVGLSRHRRLRHGREIAHQTLKSGTGLTIFPPWLARYVNQSVPVCNVWLSGWHCKPHHHIHTSTTVFYLSNSPFDECQSVKFNSVKSYATREGT